MGTICAFHSRWVSLASFTVTIWARLGIGTALAEAMEPTERERLAPEVWVVRDWLVAAAELMRLDGKEEAALIP